MGTLMVRLYWIYAAVLGCLTSSAQAAGVQLLDTDPSLAGAIWYPCAAAAQRVPLGKLTVQFIEAIEGAKDCPFTGTKLPLVIVSHGRGGWFGQHDDTVQALANAGFVVASISLPGDNGNDSSQRDSLSILASRPASIIRLLDFILNDWKDRAAIDSSRIGFFGFSLGAYTGLVLAGGNPDLRRFALYCSDANRTRACEQLRSGDIPNSLPHEPRIRAAVLADTAVNFAFPADRLADIKIPLLIWRSEFGGAGVDPKNSALVAESLPGKKEVRVVPAGHFAFLSPCSAEFAEKLPRFCADPPGFDRRAFHREFNASIIDFFRETLVRQGESR
ncbi:hydrolase [Bradyrhizobium canariense]|nr:hydrolase [Bradyrhizobium canariense]